jgi:hypothetical protein
MPCRATNLVLCCAGLMSAVSAVLPSLLACCEQEIQKILGAQQQQQQQQQQPPQEEGASNALVLLDALLSLWILYTITGVAKDPQLLQVRRVTNVLHW